MQKAGTQQVVKVGSSTSQPATISNDTVVSTIMEKAGGNASKLLTMLDNAAYGGSSIDQAGALILEKLEASRGNLGVLSNQEREHVLKMLGDK
jgi:hypothetical protein